MISTEQHIKSLLRPCCRRPSTIQFGLFYSAVLSATVQLLKVCVLAASGFLSNHGPPDVTSSHGRHCLLNSQQLLKVGAEVTTATFQVYQERKLDKSGSTKGGKDSPPWFTIGACKHLPGENSRKSSGTLYSTTTPRVKVYTTYPHFVGICRYTWLLLPGPAVWAGDRPQASGWLSSLYPSAAACSCLLTPPCFWLLKGRKRKKNNIKVKNIFQSEKKKKKPKQHCCFFFQTLEHNETKWSSISGEYVYN